MFKTLLAVHVSHRCVSSVSLRVAIDAAVLVQYTALTFALRNQSLTPVDNLDLLRTVCRVEWDLRARYSDCSTSTNETCCQFIGPGKRERCETSQLVE